MKTLRVACYERVSTDEQSRHGFSIDAQITRLETWVKNQGHIMIGHYTDAGVSGGKAIEKRPAMSRLLRDVDAGMIDMVVFTKLDRWFRSIQNYYKAQERLDAAHCAWNAVDEDYETLTSSGKFKVNIMLSVAENERLKTSERIKSVYAYKRSKGEYFSGRKTIPLGYTLKEGKVIKDPESKDAIAYFWELVQRAIPAATAGRMVEEKFGIHRDVTSWQRMTAKPIYKGCYSGQDGFCEPYVSPEVFDALFRQRPPAQVRVCEYIFTGLLKCPVCGRGMSGVSIESRHKTFRYKYYKCINRTCDYRHLVREEFIDQKIADYVIPKSGTIIVDSVKIHRSDKPKKPSISALNAKLKRLAETYTDGLIEQSEYRKRAQALKDEIAEIKKASIEDGRPTVEEVRKTLGGSYREVYDKLTISEKRQFWRRLVESFVVNESEISVKFL